MYQFKRLSKTNTMKLHVRQKLLCWTIALRVFKHLWKRVQEADKFMSQVVMKLTTEKLLCWTVAKRAFKSSWTDKSDSQVNWERHDGP